MTGCLPQRYVRAGARPGAALPCGGAVVSAPVRAPRHPRCTAQNEAVAAHALHLELARLQVSAWLSFANAGAVRIERWAGGGVGLKRRDRCDAAASARQAQGPGVEGRQHQRRRGREPVGYVKGHKAGVWSGFATAQSGDVLDLWKAARACSIVEASTGGQRALWHLRRNASWPTQAHVHATQQAAVPQGGRQGAPVADQTGPDLVHFPHEAATAAGAERTWPTRLAMCGRGRPYLDGQGRGHAAAIEPHGDQLALRRAGEPEARLPGARQDDGRPGQTGARWPADADQP